MNKAPILPPFLSFAAVVHAAEHAPGTIFYQNSYP